MARPRIRTIKPEIWASRQIMNLSLPARLLFIGLLTQADDDGRGSADPRKLRATIFPGDEDMTAARLAELLAELEAQGLIVQYQSEPDGPLFAALSWRRHQKLDKHHYTESTYPPPPGFSANPPSSRSRADAATTPSGGGAEKSSTGSREGDGDRKGSERNGRDRNGSERAPRRVTEPEVLREEKAAKVRTLAQHGSSVADIVRTLPGLKLTEQDVREMLAEGA